MLHAILKITYSIQRFLIGIALAGISATALAQNTFPNKQAQKFEDIRH